MKLQYDNAKVMDPRPGNNFCTTYFRLSKENMGHARLHIASVLEAIDKVQREDPITYAWIGEPFKGFPRQGKQANYSMMSIVTDLTRQIISGKDIPSGMLSRWNRMFKGTPWDLILTKEAQPPPPNPNLPDTPLFRKIQSKLDAQK